MSPDRDLARFMFQVDDFSKFIVSLVKGGLSKTARDEVAAASARFVAQQAANLGIQLDAALDSRASDTLTALRDRGWAPIQNVFAESQIDDIHDFIADKPVVFDTFDEEVAAKDGLIEDLPEDASSATYKSTDLCRCQLIYDVLHDERLLNLAGAYLGAPPTISNVGLWWSFANPKQPGQDQYFHHDRDDFNVTKLFVYMTNVTPETGPHAYVLQSHTLQALHEHAARLKSSKAKERYWNWMEKFRKPDDEVFNMFGRERMKVLTGPRGTSFLEDTRGLHRAVAPRTGFRLAFEVTFTVLPKYNATHRPQPRSALSFVNDPAAVSPLARYATRLLYV